MAYTDDKSDYVSGAPTAANLLTADEFEAMVANVPTTDQKSALAGTSGTAVSASNKLVDNADTRLSNPRTPSAHAGSHAAGESDEITPAAIGAVTSVDFGSLVTSLGSAALADTTDFLAADGKAADADKLDNHDSTYFQTAITTSRRFFSAYELMQTETDYAVLTQYSSSTNKVTRAYGLFAAGETKYLQLNKGLDDWNTTTIKVEPVFDSESANSGNVVFTFDALRLPDGGTIDSAWGTAVSSDDTYQGAGKQHIGPQTANITPAGASGAEIVLRITRGTDTLDGDVRLTGIWVEWPVTRT